MWWRRLNTHDFHTQPSQGFTENGPRKEKISSERQLCGWKCLVDVRGQRRMVRLVREDRKATVTQITTRYNQGMQNTISECTTRSNPEADGLQQQKTNLGAAPVNWTTEDWKNVAWSDESRFLLQHSDGRVIIWLKEHKSMDPSCLVSTVQAAGGGVMVWGMFFGTLWAP